MARPNEHMCLPRLFWVAGRIQLLEMATSRKRRRRRLAQELAEEYGIGATRYPFHMVCAKNVVYFKSSRKRRPTYAGHSGDAIPRREGNRNRKRRQEGLVEKEPAHIFWEETKSYWHYLPLVLSFHSSLHEARLREHEVIHKKKCRLNAPYIWSLKCMKRHIKGRMPKPKSFRTRRLLKRLRMKSKGYTSLAVSDRQEGSFECAQHEVWNKLYHLAERGYMRFQVSKQLRSTLTTDQDILFLYKAALKLQFPFKISARIQLRNIMRFRNLTEPKKPTPLKIATLLGDNYEGSVRKLLRELVREQPQRPFHETNICVKIVKWPTLESQFHCINGEIREGCNCQEYRRILPEEAFTENGHLVATGDMLSAVLTQEQLEIVCSNSRQSVWPSRNTFSKMFKNALQKFFNDNGLFHERIDQSKLDLWIATRWDAHVGASRLHTMVRKADVDAIKSILPETVWHCEDHAATRLVVYCAKHYLEAEVRTFEKASEIFQPVYMDARKLATAFLESIPENVRKKCSWGINYATKKILPESYVMLKRKKGFMLGRPIISYDRTALERLQKATSKLIGEIADVIGAETTFQCKSGQELLDRLKKFIDNSKSIPMGTGEHWKLQVDNEDLVGFFPSIPQQLLLDALKWAIDTYLGSTSLDNHGFTVWPETKSKKSIQGRRRSRKGVYYPTCCILEFVEFLLQNSFFINRGQILRQIRGCPIGAQLAPSLCTLAVAYVEYKWIQSNDVALRARTWECCRYVDNRLLMYWRKDGTRLSPQQLSDPHFYGFPVVLEHEPDLTVVGTQIILSQKDFGTVLIVHGFPEQQPCGLRFPEDLKEPTLALGSRWRYRAPTCLASPATRVSGLLGKLHLAWTVSHPEVNKHKSIWRLMWVFAAMGYPSQILRNTYMKFAIKKKVPTQVSQCLHLIEQKDALKLWKLAILYSASSRVFVLWSVTVEISLLIFQKQQSYIVSYIRV